MSDSIWVAKTEMSSNIPGQPVCFRSVVDKFDFVSCAQITQQLRKKRKAENLPVRKIKPATLWLLDHLVEKFVAEYSKDYSLINISIIDRRK
jgi:hypothetical protein